MTKIAHLIDIAPSVVSCDTSQALSEWASHASLANELICDRCLSVRLYVSPFVIQSDRRETFRKTSGFLKERRNHDEPTSVYETVKITLTNARQAATEGADTVPNGLHYYSAGSVDDAEASLGVTELR